MEAKGGEGHSEKRGPERMEILERANTDLTRKCDASREQAEVSLIKARSSEERDLSGPCPLWPPAS